MAYLVTFAFIGILASLAGALFFMMRGSKNDKQKSTNMFRALALRVGISIFLFLCVLAAWKLGYIHPTGIPAGQ
jgi:cytochrome bd-type quinol oxidase subunit 2